MKLLFTCSLLAISVLLEAAPSAKQFYKVLLPGVGDEKAKLGDIWKDCSKSDIHKFHFFKVSTLWVLSSSLPHSQNNDY